MARKDPFKNYRFRLELDGIQEAGFNGLTMSNSTQEPIEYREGHEPIYSRKLPGLIKYGNVTLKWGITDSMALYDWRKQIEDGDVEKARKTVHIYIQDDQNQGEDKVHWILEQAWPTVYTAPELNATGSEIAIESLEIVCERFYREAI
jgi:phage tail-like protein